MNTLVRLLIFLAIPSLSAQQLPPPDFEAVDSLYREDQFYVAFTYNILAQKQKDVSQNKFSAGFSGGFLRDMPINADRTVSIAAGLGYSLQNYNQNLKISDDSPEIHYSLIEAGNGYDKNKLSLHFVELPVEFRWRTSTAKSHRFWRIYTGVKLSYLFYSRSKYVDSEQELIVTQNPDLEKFRFGAYLATGYNTWNVYVYYGLNPIFKNATLNGEEIDMRTLNVGLMFYIL